MAGFTRAWENVDLLSAPGPLPVLFMLWELGDCDACGIY